MIQKLTTACDFDLHSNLWQFASIWQFNKHIEIINWKLNTLCDIWFINNIFCPVILTSFLFNCINQILCNNFWFSVTYCSLKPYYLSAKSKVTWIITNYVTNKLFFRISAWQSHPNFFSKIQITRSSPADCHFNPNNKKNIPNKKQRQNNISLTSTRDNNNTL